MQMTQHSTHCLLSAQETLVVGITVSDPSRNLGINLLLSNPMCVGASGGTFWAGLGGRLTSQRCGQRDRRRSA